eukprot:3867551-Amphidinium_carterae.1
MHCVETSFPNVIRGAVLTPNHPGLNRVIKDYVSLLFYVRYFPSIPCPSGAIALFHRGCFCLCQ